MTGPDVPAPCVWSRVDEEADSFAAGCPDGHLFEFTDGDPAANHFAYCPYCGHPLILKETTTDDE